jgi:hypothetical protein
MQVRGLCFHRTYTGLRTHFPHFRDPRVRSPQRSRTTGLRDGGSYELTTGVPVLLLIPRGREWQRTGQLGAKLPPP